MSACPSSSAPRSVATLLAAFLLCPYPRAPGSDVESGNHDAESPARALQAAPVPTIAYSIEEHAKSLRDDIQRLEGALARLEAAPKPARPDEQEILELELRGLLKALANRNSRLTHIEESHRRFCSFLADTIKGLQDLRGYLSADTIAAAVAALERGEVREADAALQSVAGQK